jgi:hypothetical protein
MGYHMTRLQALIIQAVAKSRDYMCRGGAPWTKEQIMTEAQRLGSETHTWRTGVWAELRNRRAPAPSAQEREMHNPEERTD